MITDEERVITRIKKQRAHLFGCTPGAHSLMGFLPIEANDRIATFATDGEKIFVNTAYAESVNDFDVRGIIIHESLHIGYKHHLRLAAWTKICGLSEGDAHELWNIGSDYSINGKLKESANYGTDFTIPDGTLWHDDYSTNGWPVEKICNDMLQKGWESKKQKPDGPEGGSGDGETGDDSDETQDGDGPPMEHGCGEILVPEEFKGDSQEVADAIEKESQNINRRVAEAAILERQIGQGKGGLVTKIFESTGQTTSAEHIRHFLRQNFSYKRSFKKPNRRFLHRNIYLPSKVKTPHTLYACIDSSASMGLKEFENCRANLVRWAKDLGLSKIRVAYVDSDIHMNPDTDEPWFDIDLRYGTGADALELDIHGGGGTSFDPIFQHLENVDDIGGLVYFTDGFGAVTVDPPKFPVLWITTSQAPIFYNSEGEFGKLVFI